MPYASSLSDSIARIRLPNGLRVVASRDPRAPLIVTRLAVQAGGRDEPPDRCGLAHLCEHLACDAGTLSTRTRRLGGTSNGWIFPDYAAFGTTIPSAACAASLRVEADRLAWRPRDVSRDRLRTEADTLLQERHDRGGVPFARELEYVHRLLYPPTHPYHRPAIGLPSGLRAIGDGEPAAFVDAHYRPHRAVLIVVGDVDADDVVKEAEAAFAALDAVAAAPESAETPPPVQSPAQHAVVELEVPYVRTYLAMRAPGHGAPGWHAMSVFARWLGTGRTNPLHRLLVEDLGLAQEVRVCWESFRDASTLAFVCTATPDTPHELLEQALNQALDDALGDGPTEADLDRARTKALIDRYAQDDSLETRADWLTSIEMLRTPADDNDAPQLATLTAASLLQHARLYACEERRVQLSLIPRRSA